MNIWKSRFVTVVLFAVLALSQSTVAWAGLEWKLPAKNTLAPQIVKGNLSYVKKVMGQNPKLVDAPDEYKRTPLMYAAWTGNLPIVQYLVSKGAKASGKSGDVWKPMPIAACMGHLPVVKYLVSKGAKLNEKNGDGSPLLTTVAYFTAESVPQNRQFEVMNYLIANGANVNAKDSNGATAVSEAASRRNFPVVRFLISKGANPNGPGLDTSFIEALIGNKDYKTFKGFIDLGVKVNAKDINRLLIAADDNNAAEIARYLISKGAKRQPFDVNRVDEKGSTRLHIAAESNDVEKIKNLLSKGASLNLLDKEGLTPLDRATRQNYQKRTQKAVDLLRKVGAMHGEFYGAELRPISLGDIGLYGTVSAVDTENKVLTLNVISFTLASGKSSVLAKPKMKTVTHDAGYDETITEGTAIFVVGEDLGSGQSLNAKELIVLK